MPKKRKDAVEHVATHQPLPGQLDFIDATEEDAVDIDEELAAGQADVEAGRLTDHEEVEKEFLPPVREVQFSLPLAASWTGYVSKHVEAQLQPHQGEALKSLFLGLDQRGARLRNGKRIATNADVIKYLLEQVMPSHGETATP